MTARLHNNGGGMERLSGQGAVLTAARALFTRTVQHPSRAPKPLFLFSSYAGEGKERKVLCLYLNL